MKDIGMRPGLVRIQRDGYLALVILAEDPIDEDTRNLFFASLNQYKHNPNAKEVVLIKSGITLNISALDQPEAIELQDLTKLFNTSQPLRTFVCYLGEKRIRNLSSHKIVSVSENNNRPLDAVKKAFILDLKLKNRQVIRQCFSAPGCPGYTRRGNYIQFHRT